MAHRISRSVFDTVTTSRAPLSPVPQDLLSKALLGDSRSNTLTGSTTKTVFFGGAGNDKIVGKSSVKDSNIAVYTYSIDKYKITTTRDGFTVKALTGSEGTDTLINISKLIFAGVTYDLHATTIGTTANLTLTPPVDTAPSAPTQPSTPSTPTPPVDTAPTTPTTPTEPSTPSTPTPPVDTAPTTPTTPTEPSTPSTPTPPVDTAPTTPTTPTTPASPPQSAPVTSTPGDVVGFGLQNVSGSAEGTGYVTFGQVFAKGSVMPGDTLIAKINGQNVAVQMDVKTTNPDGSVGHAILTLKAPAIATDGSLSGMIAKASSPAPSGAAIQAQDIVQHGYSFKVDVTLHNADGSNTVKTIDAAQLLQQAINSGSVETWLKGSQTGEYRVATTIAPNLEVKFDIRMDADGKTHTDVIFARDDAYTTNTATLNYDVKFTQDGQTVFSQANIQQYAYSTWHEAVSSPGSIDPHVVYDIAYLMKTGAIPTYDLNSSVSTSMIAGLTQSLAQSNTGPMGSALVEKYMPGVGGRADIGPETTWTATYLVSQNADAAKVMFANADASGSVPWHMMDTNGDAVRIDLHPKLWVDYRGTPDNYGSDAMPNGFTSSSDWSTDIAHQPALTYVPYLLSGTHYYLDELQAQAAYSIASINPNYRDLGTGLLTDVNQVRAVAWALRDLSNAAYISPDADAMKTYFAKIVGANLDAFIANYVNGAAGNAEGQLEGWIRGEYGTPNMMAPWQQDYLATTFATLAARGETKAATMLDWMDGFLSGRFLNEANGFDPLYGPAYNLKAINPATGQLFQTWAEVYQATFGSTHPTGLDGYPDWAGGYAANAKAALAGVISATQSPDAIEAYGWLQSQTTAMKADYATNPTWNIAPKLANGEYLTNDEVSVLSTTTGGTLTAGNGEQMLIGNIGNDTIVGGSGIAMLFGMDGNDTLRAGSGNSYLYGGDGNDRLQDGAGANYFKGGVGADVFAFTSASTGRDTIADFTKGVDRIEIKSNLNGSGITTAAQVVANATADASGNAVLHLGPQHDIVLQGVLLHQVTADIFTIV